MSYTLFNSVPTPSGLATNGPDTFGVVFTSLLPGNVIGVMFYKTVLNTGTHIGNLWSIGGSNLAQVTFTGETASGWQYMPFASPYPIVANTQYVISHTNSGVNYGYLLPNPAQVVGTVFGNPLGTPAINTYNRYHIGAGVAFPATDGSNFYYMANVVLDNVVVPSGIRDVTGKQCVVGALQGVSIGGMTSIHGDTFDRHLKTGVRKELVEGSPSAPCLALDYPGFWRFRWTVKPGAHSVSVLVKQVANVAPYPSLIVKANADVGLLSDVTVSGSGGTGWSTAGPALATFSAEGSVWVELWNNCKSVFQSPAYFDHLVFT